MSPPVGHFVCAPPPQVFGPFLHVLSVAALILGCFYAVLPVAASKIGILSAFSMYVYYN